MPVKQRIIVVVLLLLLAVATAVFAAVDTRDKRGGASSIGTAWVDVLPNPSGSIGDANRQQVAGEYPGILSDEPVIQSTIGGRMLCHGLGIGCRRKQ